MTTESQTDTNAPAHPFEKGLEIYENKGDLKESIELFEQGVLMNPRDSTGYTCLAWLHLLRNEEGDATKGVNYASKAVRLDRSNQQAHFNLVLAMLVVGRSGVRKEFDAAKMKCHTQEEMTEIIENLQDAVVRRPDYSEASKLLNWLGA